MLKHITVILQIHGMYELSILKTHGNHLIKAMKSYDYWTHDIYLFHIKLMLTIYLTSQYP